MASNATTQLYAIQVGKLYYGFRAKKGLYTSIIGYTGVSDASADTTLASAAGSIKLQPKTPIRVLVANGLVVPLRATCANGKKYRIFCSSEKMPTGPGDVLEKELLGSKVTNVGLRERRYLK